MNKHKFHKPAAYQPVCCLFLQADDMESWHTLPDTVKQEIGSPFCFLCENPKHLVVPQQMRGHPSDAGLSSRFAWARC